MPSEFDPDQVPEVPEPVDTPSTEPAEQVPEPEPEPVETPEQARSRILEELFPYPRDPAFHPLASLFINMPHLKLDADAAHATATWVFDRLGCAGPGTASTPTVKYDALGSSGAPWEYGVWIKAEAERVPVEVTTPEVVLTDMDEAALAEVISNAQAALVAKRAGTAKEA